MAPPTPPSAIGGNDVAAEEAFLQEVLDAQVALHTRLLAAGVAHHEDLVKAAKEANAPPDFVAEIEAELKVARAGEAELAGAIAEARRVPKPEAGVFIVHGRVRAAPGARKTFQVRFSDPEGKVSKRFEPIVAGENGRFTARIRAAEFPDLFDGKTSVFLRVTDERGVEIAAPAEPLLLEAGVIVLNVEEAETRAPAPPPAPRPRARTPPGRGPR